MIHASIARRWALTEVFDLTIGWTSFHWREFLASAARDGDCPTNLESFVARDVSDSTKDRPRAKNEMHRETINSRSPVERTGGMDATDPPQRISLNEFRGAIETKPMETPKSGKCPNGQSVGLAHPRPDAVEPHKPRLRVNGQPFVRKELVKAPPPGSHELPNPEPQASLPMPLPTAMTLDLVSIGFGKTCRNRRESRVSHGEGTLRISQDSPEQNSEGIPSSATAEEGIAVLHTDPVFTATRIHQDRSSTLTKFSKRIQVYCEEPPTFTGRSLLEIQRTEKARGRKPMHGFKHPHQGSTRAMRSPGDPGTFGHLVRPQECYNQEECHSRHDLQQDLLPETCHGFSAVEVRTLS